MKLVFKTLLLFLVVMCTSGFFGRCDQELYHPKMPAINFESDKCLWADSVLGTMSLNEKIAQLMMLAVYSNKDEKYNQQVINLILKHQLGGVIFMQGGPVRQAQLTNRLQEVAKIPLIVAIDAEWGLNMRLDSTIAFPRALALGAVHNENYLYDFGFELARQCKRIGVNVNFTPVLDINVEPENPVINSRSFGEDKNKVVLKALAITNGMQDNRVLAVGKHFPGHGDTRSDSHFALPVVNYNRKRLNKIELFPFKNLIQHGIGGIMVAHLSVPAFEADSTIPATLSKSIVDSLLKGELNFKGLIFTDALNMKGVADGFKPGEIELKALLAGNDILLFPQDIDLAITKISDAVQSGLISEEEINKHCLKILKSKSWLGVDKFKPIEIINLKQDLNTPYAQFMNSLLVEKSLTLIQQSSEVLIPVKELAGKKILSICFGGKPGNEFQQYLNLYTRVDTININGSIDDQMKNQLIDSLKRYDMLIVSTLGTNEIPKQNFGVNNDHLVFIEELAAIKPTVFVHLGNPYALRSLSHSELFNSILIGYQDTPESRQLSAQVVFGGVVAEGQLPVTIGANLKAGLGMKGKQKPIRLKYTGPYEFNLGENVFQPVDSIIKKCIDDKVMPGCQLLFASHGKVIYHKAYGYHTYEKETPVKLSDIYDLASVTKIAATTMALMKLTEEKEIRTKDEISRYLPDLIGTDKEHLTFEQILTHQAGLHSWIPFYKNTMDENMKLKAGLYTNDSSQYYSLKVNEKMWLRSDYVDSMYQAIADTPVYEEKKYRYSDLGYYWFLKLIKEKTGKSLDVYCAENFYGHLGMNNTSFKPAEHFDIKRIPPTEDDKVYRNVIVKGYVHDMGAAMLGGVGGHAGLFANANDLAKLGQMWLNMGTYGGCQYLKRKTLCTFTEAPFKNEGNRRALGFDKPTINKGEVGPTCELASQQSYGHTGFTGAYLWIDPENQSIMVFLTNRTFPDQENKKLADLNIRTQIQEYFYKAITQ